MSNEDQKEYWNDSAGTKWAEHQLALDAMLAPVTSLLMETAAVQPDERVLDIGCGTGETSVIAADAGGQITGVDISEAMLALAQRRIGDRGTMLLADASEYQSQEHFDLVLSRFGVMFFDDPVEAFQNICANLKPGGRMVFACWQAPPENMWVMVPMKAIMPLLPDTPDQDPHAPGPFAFADPERLRGILTDAGFVQVRIEPHSVDISLAQDGGVDRAVSFTSQIGPAARALADVDADVRPKITAALKAALEPYDRDGRVVLGGGIWIVQARRSA